jgi:hypothetical protein
MVMTDPTDVDQKFTELKQLIKTLQSLSKACLKDGDLQVEECTAEIGKLIPELASYSGLLTEWGTWLTTLEALLPSIEHDYGKLMAIIADAKVIKTACFPEDESTYSWETCKAAVSSTVSEIESGDTERVCDALSSVLTDDSVAKYSMYMHRGIDMADVATKELKCTVPFTNPSQALVRTTCTPQAVARAAPAVIALTVAAVCLALILTGFGAYYIGRRTRELSQ